LSSLFEEGDLGLTLLKESLFDGVCGWYNEFVVYLVFSFLLIDSVVD
jgi:hypothetical protein